MDMDVTRDVKFFASGGAMQDKTTLAAHFKALRGFGVKEVRLQPRMKNANSTFMGRWERG